MAISALSHRAFRMVAVGILATATAIAAADFTTLPLATAANTGFVDQQPGDQKGGWTDQGGNDLRVMSPGTVTASGVPFEILAEAANSGKTCIVLGGPERPYLPKEAKLTVTGSPAGTCLYLLHAAAWGPVNLLPTVTTGKLKVEYIDGTTSEFTVNFGQDVGDWTRPDSYANAARAWTAYNGNTQVSLFVSKFPLQPQPLKSLQFAIKDSAWMVVAATLGPDVALSPIRADLRLERKFTAPTLDAPLADDFGEEAPRNIILIIGDGMGPGALKLTSLYQHGAEGRLVMEQLPVVGLCTTSSEGGAVTDSAAAATALACGRKTINGMLGLTPKGEKLVSVARLARQNGRAVGLITTDPVTGATPAGFYAQVSSRGSYAAVADCIIPAGFDLLLGHDKDRLWCLPKSAGGQRADERNLLEEIGAAGYTSVKDLAQLKQAPEERRVFGQIDGAVLFNSETCLGEFTAAAITRLARNQRGFFLMVESSLPDGGGHSNKPEYTVCGTLQADWTVKAALDFALPRKDTLVLVTADHETGGLSCTMSRTAPHQLVIHYATTGHTGLLVNVYAFGPGARRFAGLIDNTDFARNIARLWELELPPPAP